MRYPIPLNSRIFLPATVPAIHATLTHTFVTIGSRLTTDHNCSERRMKYLPARPFTPFVVCLIAPTYESSL